MIRELISILAGFGAIYLTPKIESYSIIGLMIFIEFVTVLKGNKYKGISFIVGMIIGEIYLLYTGVKVSGIENYLYVVIYLTIRYKGDEHFIDNKVNGFLYLLFAFSVPIFIDFITQLANIKINLILFVTLYLIFLRISDWILISKFNVLLFSTSQIVFFTTLDNFILQNNMKFYFMAGILMWTILKWKAGGKRYVSRIFGEEPFRKSS